MGYSFRVRGLLYAHIMAFVIPVVEHWFEIEIAEVVHHKECVYKLKDVLIITLC